MSTTIKYIPKSIFSDWVGLIESSSIKTGDREKIYGMLEYSYKLLDENCNDFQRIDIISNLRRIISKRVQTIFNTYKIDNVEFKIGNDKKFEKLERLQLVKPLLLHELLKIRNGVEYNDKKPPSVNKLKKLIDTTWYFIRSTDIYVSNIPNTILFEHHNEKHWLEVDYNFKNKWSFEVRGWVSQNKIYNSQKINTFKLQLTDLHNKKECFNPKNHKNKLLTDFYIRGKIDIQGEEKIDFISLYFAKFYL